MDETYQNVRPDLELVPTTSSAPGVNSRTWRGFAVEQVVLDEVEGYSFCRTGPSHYVALHDIQQSHGEAKIVDGQASRLTNLRNTLTFLPAGADIQGWSEPEGNSNSFVALYFDPDILSAEIGDAYRNDQPRPVLYGRSAQLELTMTKLSRLDLHDDSTAMLAEQMCVMAALETLDLASLPQQAASGGLSQRQLEWVKDFMDANLFRDIGLPELAAAAGLSRFHFVRAFRKSTGATPYAFLMNMRVENAKKQLLSSSLPMAAIAQTSGFKDERQMRRALVKATGLPPAAYRRSAE